MRQIHILIAVGIMMVTPLWGQVGFPDYPEDYHAPDMLKSGTTGSQYIPHGLAFTPKGDLRAMIVCVGFGSPYDGWDCPNWSTGTNTLPNWANNPEFMYTSNSDFSTFASANHYQNFSRFYHEMSNQKFRFIANVFPHRININPTGIDTWEAANLRVMEVLKAQHPNFNWSPFDGRANPSNYAFDSSNSTPDSVVDFLIIVYRYNGNDYWKTNFPIPYLANGFASNSIPPTFSYNGYGFNSMCGYTQITGGDGFYQLFIHELAHNIFNSPHYAGANGIVGNYFYGQNGWGMMSLSSIFNSALGWERWLLDWIDIKANGVNSDIVTASNLPSSGEFILRDHITTGDVIRIRLNSGTGNNQYLWLENHQGLSIFDNRTWKTNGCGNSFPPEPRGLVAYIESIKDDKTIPIDFWGDVRTRNGIQFIHPAGNFDYSTAGSPTYPCALWGYSGNPSYDFHEVQPNPISGQSRIEWIRWDIDNNGSIGFNNNANSTGGQNEHARVAKRDGVETLDCMGVGLAFPAGKRLGMDTNPSLVSRPLFQNTSNMGYHYLNGISITNASTVLDQLMNRVRVLVKFNDVEVKENVRWAGNIALNNITSNSNPDLVLHSGHQILINKSGTPNRTTRIDSDFINYTKFKCEDGGYFLMQPDSRVILDESSAFTIESGSVLEVGDNSEFRVSLGGTLQVRNGAELRVTGTGRVDVENGANICVENGATINLQDALSAINLRPGYSIGVNTSVVPNPGTCTSASSIRVTGNGLVNTQFTSSTYVQNETFGTNRYITGSNIYVGRAVTTAKPQGDVVINSGAHVILDAMHNIYIEPGFEVKLGGVFEIR